MGTQDFVLEGTTIKKKALHRMLKQVKGGKPSAKRYRAEWTPHLHCVTPPYSPCIPDTIRQRLCLNRWGNFERNLENEYTQSQEWDPGHREAETFDSGCLGPCSLASIWPPGPLLLFTGVSTAWSPESLGWLMRAMQVEFNLILF